MRTAGQSLPKLMRTLGRASTFCSAIGLVAFGALASAHADSAFRLQPQTRVKVAIVEWMASTGEYKEWSALNGEYSVSPSGTISVPMVGEITAKGRTPAELSSAIADLLKQRTGLMTAPQTTVEVIRYPMIYVTGLVDRPSELEYRPGLMVMQAVTMAGGRERRTNPAGGYSDMEQIRYTGELNRVELELLQLAARRARLRAEFGESPKVEFPPVLTGAKGAAIQQMIRDETTLFDARREALRRQIESLNELATLLKNEIDVLEEKRVFKERQVVIAQDELKGVSKLLSDQTVTKSRQTSLERILAELQSDNLDLQIAAMRARQKLSETERDVVTLQGQRRTEAGRDLQTTEASIEDLKVKRNTYLQLLQVNGASLSRIASLKTFDQQPLEYWITRAGQDAPFRVTDSTLLVPGDVLDVRSPLPEAVDMQLLSSVGIEQSQ
ncbi:MULTISPECIES: polysaccharide biosynthesis/export family protein [Sinorhizobium]|uniref:Sugar transporter n=2 Tax=Sinorhizobium TaxID=28105 RepID=A0A2S3YS73_9HYPH|nr:MULTISPECIES: polysaccharide biosynthesis/export family protein [Sinorhizobium]ASY59894.1 Capsule polysaccharide export protein [Sinorhizobium sp. CCBAU 05631]AUX80110.1 polysaccharide biosynthesis/export protein [Sinorhizobium fredii]PDT43504.1 sugar transporter [Sinorhizobium sp. FG01]POH34502.1 sugar transporter [Sinorhizobium americanum]